MKPIGINPDQPFDIQPLAPKSAAGNFADVFAEEKKSQGLGGYLNTVINELNDLQSKSTDMTKAFAAGENVELQDVMLAQEEAGLALRLTMQLRNKVLEAYREILHMGV